MFLKGPTAPLTFFTAWLAFPFLLLFVSFFQTSFLTAIKPESSSNESSQTAKNHEKMRKSHRNTPKVRTCKKSQSGKGQTSEIDNLTTLSAVFPKAQSSQSRAKMEAKMGSSGNQNHEKSATRAPQKTLKRKPTKSWTRFPFWCQKRTSISHRFGALFEAWAALGPNWSPSLPREPPGWSQTLDLMIFRGFWMDVWLLFTFAHLSVITFFAIVLGFLFG